MKKQDTEESPTQGSEDAPPTAEGTESPAAAKDSLDSNSPKESEPQTPQTDTPPQSDEAGSDGKVEIIYKLDNMLMTWLSLCLCNTRTIRNMFRIKQIVLSACHCCCFILKEYADL